MAVWILGVGMTRFGVFPAASVAELTREAVGAAVADAGLALGDIGAAFFGNTAQGALEGQLMIGGQVALRPLGIERIPVFNVENACATGATALHLAVNHVRAGAADVALAVGVERLNVGDRRAAMSVFDGAYDVSAPEELQKTLLELGGDDHDPGTGDRSVFMNIYAALARAHMDEFGTTQRQLAAVAAKNHRHAVANPKAHYRAELTVDEVLAARRLAFPLTVPMCAPITDGAAAVLVGGKDVVARLGRDRSVQVRASVVGTGTNRPLRAYDQHVSRLVAQRAYEAAGLGPGDVDVAEVHDATSFAEILQTELLGLCEPGDGGPAAEAGTTSLAGRIPVNPSGGLVSKGHPLGATGLGQVHELVTQLRGEAAGRQVPGAWVGLAENGGGFHQGEEAVAAITILSV